ncbi:MAG: undecaprenyldiphospho-muramoylpentapeptide beta-N-acetylglucosaminyltransferase [Proteobacteria bacterium]|nr:undecaprenyldiphospho-muramoylpentapeptide beta-N-acetylglucosaminyltransferase [Pseudomonadota bacterium]
MTRVPENLRVLVAGGGTGGHLFPGIAVAEAIRDRAPESRILFAGTRKPFEARVTAAAGFEHTGLDVEGFSNRSLGNKAKAGAKFSVAMARALAATTRFRPHLVLGVGGYSSAPWVLAGGLLNISTAIQEQNVHPGAASRLGARVAGRIYVSWPQSVRYFPGRETRLTGNPVRPSLLEQARGQGEKPGVPFTVAVLGGSQGAAGINRAVGECLAELAGPAEVRFIHQTGEADHAAAATAMKDHPGGAEVAPFFQDMGRVYAQADLLVCRSGATTMAEITALGKAAILVPFPQAAENHQEKNARFLEEAGAARVILERDLAGPVLAGMIEELKGDPGKIVEMEEKSRALGRPGAAAELAADLLEWIGEG